VRLTFYGGVGEIGGNKFLLESRGSRLFLDFGRSYEREKRFYEEPFLRPRGERHLIELGILPLIKGLYKCQEESCHLDGVVVSHAHRDHMDAIRYLKDEFPVYCSETTREIIKAREYSGISDPGYCISRLTKDGEECLKTFVECGDPSHIDAVEITQLAVDHSVPGASATVVDDGDCRLAYTGDIRFHGPSGELSSRFVSKAAGMDLDILLIEGTNMREGRMSSEGEVLLKAREVVESCGGLVMLGYHALDLDRMRTFVQVAGQCDRCLAVSMKQAFLLMRLGETVDLDIDPSRLFVFRRDKKTTYRYESEVLDAFGGRVVGSADINERQDRFLLTFTLFDMNESIDIVPWPGSVYILSSSEPFNEEMEISYERLCNWLDHLGMPLYQIHASGHGRPFELRRMVEEIGPRTVVPVHTTCPELYARYLADLECEVIVPGEKMTIER